ncbi:MAG: DUF4352 domain-containing protein [Nanoarchaeota archaeon]|nr:DUF4352 domain-containing protein [Nanoarchaeota archaeon]MBU1977469.1 DUF4352 domain-containing protein [Nanoarchaeota archaeon]
MKAHLIALFIIGLFLLGGCVEFPEDTSTTIDTKANTQNEVNTQTNQKTNEVQQTEQKTAIEGSSRTNPASADKTVTTKFEHGWSDSAEAQIKITSLIRGTSAWSMIKEANMFNDEPAEGKEYILAKVYFKLIKNSNGESYSIPSYKFDAVSSSGKVYESASVVEPEPELSTELYPGADHEGWIAFEVDKSDKEPLMVFNRGSEGEVWIQLYGLQSATSTTTNPKDETEETTNVEEVTKLYSMNEEIEVDYLTYEITKAETFIEMGTSMFNKETSGKFIKVYLDITNNAKETKQIFTPRFKIEDNQDRKYDRLSDDMMYIADYLEFGKQLQPGLTTSGAIVFELPKDSLDLNLIISGDWLSVKEVKIKLSSIKNIGKDTTQQDEQDEMWDEAMEESEQQMEELMNKCNSPFKCSSSCPEYMDVGQKDCSSGQLCCMQ